MVRQVGKKSRNGKFHWVDTDEFVEGHYDLAQDIQSKPLEEQKAFWTKNFVEINIDVDDLEGTEIGNLDQHMHQLGPLFPEHNRKVFINIDLYGTVTARAHNTNVLTVDTVSSLVTLALMLRTFKALESCVITLSTPKDNKPRYLDWQWLDHAVPFKGLSCPLEIKWNLEGLNQKRVRGEHLHHLNLEWAKIRKELDARFTSGSFY